MRQPDWEKDGVSLFLGDCLEILPELEAGSVDAILTDIPYGTTQCSWDEIIPFEPMWKEVKRLLKPRGVFVTTASQPFTSKLVISNLDWFKYEWIWDKELPIGFLDANRKPLKVHENILVFSLNGHNYNPQKWKSTPYKKGKRALTPSYGVYKCEPGINTTGERFPVSVLEITNADRNGDGHPTQKPVDLYAYLTRTYSNDGDTILDFTMGSGTTGVACVQTGRKFIGIEIDPGYFDVAVKRISQAQLQIRMDI